MTDAEQLQQDLEAAAKETRLVHVLSPLLRKHAYSNILKTLQPKKGKFQIKILMFFIFLLKT